MELHALQRVVVQDQNGSLHIGRQALRNALYATTDFEGLSGRLRCDEFGDCGMTHINIVRLDHPEDGLGSVRENIVAAYSTDE